MIPRTISDSIFDDNDSIGGPPNEGRAVARKWESTIVRRTRYGTTGDYIGTGSQSSMCTQRRIESNHIIATSPATRLPYRTVRSLPIRIIPYSSTPYHSILQTQRHNDTTTRSKTCVRAAGPTTVDQTATSYDHQSPTATETFTPVAYSSTSYYYSYYYYYYYYSYYSYATLGRRRQQLG